jgi:DNA polymerase I-like protein with 3'-5' exonuclease and polymerase domains
VAGLQPETQRLAEDGGEVAVYDILNCGPRHRFVANGLIVHNCQYRIGKENLLLTAVMPPYNLPLSPYEIDTLLGVYHRTYPRVREYWETQIFKARNRGYAQTIAGRRVKIAGSWLDRKQSWKMESTAINFPIQGIGADQKYLALMVIQPYLTKLGGRFYFELHDGIYALLPDKVALKGALAIRDALNNMPYQKAWGFTPPIPLPWDLKMGSSWGDMKEIN